VTLGDFFMLDTETFEWTELTAENCAGLFPEGRAGHRMVSIRDKLFLFGGGVWDKSRRSWLAKINATHVFDPRT
jgi:N-acetylneuraminic acid mutarotase